MQGFLKDAALEQGFDETQATMLASCGRNIYAIGCEYHPNTYTMLQEICRVAAQDGAPWAQLMLRCIDGQMPRLRSYETASMRLTAAKAAAARRKAMKPRGGGA